MFNSKLYLPSTTPYFIEIVEQANFDGDSLITNKFKTKINLALTKSIRASSPLKDIYSGIEY